MMHRILLLPLSSIFVLSGCVDMQKANNKAYGIGYINGYMDCISGVAMTPESDCDGHGACKSK